MNINIEDLPDEQDFVNAPGSMNNGEAAAWVQGWNACREHIKNLILDDVDTPDSINPDLHTYTLDTDIGQIQVTVDEGDHSQTDTGTQAAAGGAAENAGIHTTEN